MLHVSFLIERAMFEATATLFITMCQVSRLLGNAAQPAGMLTMIW